MTRALASLTGRGQAFLSLGVIAAVLAFTLADRDLGRLALALLVLPVLSVVATARSRSQLGSHRSITRARISAGESVDVHIRLSNPGRVPSGVLLAEDTLPFAFGGRPRFIVDRLRPQSTVDVHYPIRCELRGRYTLGPLTVRLRDPFGLVERNRAFPSTEELVVTPAVVELPGVPLGGEWAGLGESTRRAVATAGEDDAATREYRLGDDLRRVHWRSTARRGELMVRREEQPWSSRAVLLLDIRATVHVGTGGSSTLEWAIAAAASIGAHLDGLGYGLRLVFDDGVSISGGRAGERFVDVMLDALATVEPSRSASLSPGLATLSHGGGEGLVVALLGGCDDTDLQALLRARSHGVTAVAILLDCGTGGGRYNATATARLLTASGWRVVIADRGSDIRDIWVRAGDRLAATLDPTATATATATATGMA